MYKAKPERAAQFWRALQDFWIKLYGSSNVFIAALNVRGDQLKHLLIVF